MRLRVRGRARGWLLALVLTGWPAAAFAQDEAFRKGMDARDDEKWPDVAAAMRDAIRVNPQESTRKVGARLGIGGNEYLPHFHLGEALFRSGDCAAAMGAWEESERQGVVRKLSRQAGVLRKGTDECQAKGFLSAGPLMAERERVDAALAAAAAAEQDVAAVRASSPDAATPEVRAGIERARADLAGARKALEGARQSRRRDEFARAYELADAARRGYAGARGLLDTGIASSARFGRQIDEVDRTIAQAQRTAESITALLKTSPVTMTPTREIGEARRKAAEALAAARETLATARNSRADADLQQARSLAITADVAYARVRTDLDEMRTQMIAGALQNLETATLEAFAGIEARLAEARAAPADAGDRGMARAAELERVADGIARARRALAAAIKKRDLPAARSAAETVADAHAALDRLATLASAAARGVVPQPLRDAAQAYFESRYQAVLNTLTDAVTSSLDASARVHGHVLRAAALLALFEYSGRRDASLRDRARADVQAGRLLDPAFRPSPAAFSPRFIAFFDGSP